MKHILWNDIDAWQTMAKESHYSALDLCRRIGYSRRQLQRYTQHIFGHSPQAFLNRLRLAGAPRLLREGVPVKEAAFILGFKQPSHFSRVFKLQYGVGPKRFLDASNATHIRQPANNVRLLLGYLGRDVAKPDKECPTQIPRNS